MDRTDVAIVGAGPYGLATAAHLRASGARHRVLGIPMDSWRSQMPAGMLLKSEGFASNIAAPSDGWSLEHYCRNAGIPYRHYGWPIPLHVFMAYGMDFQRRNVPDVQETQILHIERWRGDYVLHLSDGERLETKKVVVASGLTDFSYLPPILESLPSDRITHSSEHHDYSRFKNIRVCVIGAGASALDVAAAAHVAGAHVHLVARRKTLLWIAPRTRPPLFEQWHMRDVLGAGRVGQGHFYSQAPQLFRYLPARARTHIVKTFLGPRGGWPIRTCIENLQTSLGYTLKHADLKNDELRLYLASPDGKGRQVVTDHVIAGTGFRVDSRRLSFLRSDVLKDLKLLDGYPILSPQFESSVRGLYFAGVSAAYSFGPLMRFVAGSRFAARRISQHLATNL